MVPRYRRIRSFVAIAAVADDRLRNELLFVMLGDRHWRRSVGVIVERSGS